MCATVYVHASVCASVYVRKGGLRREAGTRMYVWLVTHLW